MTKYRVPIFILFFLLAILSILSIPRLKFTFDFEQFFPKGDPDLEYFYNFIEDFESDFQINVLGAVRFIKEYLSTLKKSENASVLLFSTVAVKLGMPFHSSIAVAKAGIEGLTRSLGAELAPKIRVNAIAPTVTNTELAAKILRNETAKEAIKERHPLKKYLSTNEVAAMANFLISENALSISGQVLELDCGIVTFKI